MRRLALFSLIAAGCSGNPTPPDAGPLIDTSCGIDCASQRKFGLIAGTCFEYSDGTTTVSPPVLAAEVMPMVSLEGGLPVMQVKYTSGGQRRQQDSFAIVDGTLLLVRREFGPGGISVSYKKTSGELEGVKWLSPVAAAGENQSSTSNADVINGTRASESTTYRVALSAATQPVPYPGLDAGVMMLITETPDHGSDSRRYFVRDVGFSMITTPLAIVGGTSQEYRLQNIKNTADAGACGF